MGTVITFTTSRDTVVITGDDPNAGPTYDVLDQWYSVQADLRYAKRPGAPGAFAPERSFPNDLLVSVEGQFFAETTADALAMRERLSGLYDDGLEVTMTVADDLRTTTRAVHVEAVAFPWTARREIRFTVDARAADPRRYGDTQSDETALAVPGGGLIFPLVFPLDFGVATVDGRVDTVNAGTTATSTRFVVSGGGMPDGFILANVSTGQRVTYVGPVASSNSIVLDFEARVAFINGTAPGSRFLSSPEWWQVPAGSTLQVQFLARGETTGTPTLSAATASAYY